MTKQKNPSSLAIPRLSELLTDGEPNEMCWEYISTLSKIVIAKCFSKYLEHFDIGDLAQLATCDAIAFVKKVASLHTGEDIKNTRNVLFTRIRNTLSNFIFRSNKLVNTDDEELDRFTVYPKAFDMKSDLVDIYDLMIDSIDSCRKVSVRTWKLFQSNSAQQKYFITNKTDDIEDWETYSEIRNMKSPCDLISIYDMYTEDQVEELAEKLDAVQGQNYFSTLYQLLGDKFLPFLDVFQEDKFDIPSTTIIRHLLTDLSICKDHSNGLSVDELSSKYSKSPSVIQNIIDSQDII